MVTHIYESNIPGIVAQYNKIHSNKLNISDPKTFTEKIQWLKVYDSTFLKTFCADKINVHRYFQKTLGIDIGVPIIKICKLVDQITTNDLSNQCVIKCNHGSGMNVVIKPNTPHASLSEIKQKLINWLHHDHGKPFHEAHYSLIKPTVFIEKYVENMTDVKVFCFNGTPKFYQVDMHLYERRQNFYDLNWNPMVWLSRTDYPADYSKLDPIPPINMLYNFAAKLCKPFKFVRCDFIITPERIYGGELTFTPGAGNQSYYGDADVRLGELLKI